MTNLDLVVVGGKDVRLLDSHFLKKSLTRAGAYGAAGAKMSSPLAPRTSYRGYVLPLTESVEPL